MKKVHLNLAKGIGEFNWRQDWKRIILKNTRKILTFNGVILAKMKMLTYTEKQLTTLNI